MVNDWQNKNRLSELAQGVKGSRVNLAAPADRAAEGGDRWMNSKHRTIRAVISSIGPRRAESYIRAFDLRDDEILYIVEREVKGKSIEQIAQTYNVSVETVKRRRKDGFRKIAEQIG